VNTVPDVFFNPKYALGIVMKWRNPIMKVALARFLFEGV
jgi:hypothetical protein